MLALHWGADGSATGMERSFGLMVNYEYDWCAMAANKARWACTVKSFSCPPPHAPFIFHE